MKLYNTLTRKKEEFVPLEEGKVKMYVCGPTVYNYIHIGNARPMIVFDTVRRYMEYKGYDVNFVSNFTDVDDKIIAKAMEENSSAEEVAKRFIEECKKDMSGMNVKEATTHPLATQEIDGMIEMIAELIEKGYAYPAADGTVYFRTRKFKDYGKLSHKNIDDLQAGHRDIKVTGDLKEDALDFVLWKPKKEGEPYWESPWCKGRPGWHIECSVMSKKYLGDEIDIHAGGEDLIFPHHENEIAQSEAANGAEFSKYWMHNAFLNIDNKKMSKSLGNFLTIDDLLKNYDANTIRFFILTNHYRMPVEFSDEALQAAANGVKRMLNAKQTPVDETLDITKLNEYKEFVEAMDEDLNTSKALAVLFDLTGKANKDVDYAFTLLFKLASVLGFTFEKAKLSEEELAEKLKLVSAELGETYASMEEVIEKRKQARAEKNWEVADKIRVALDNVGLVLKDSKDGTICDIKG